MQAVLKATSSAAPTGTAYPDALDELQSLLGGAPDVLGALRGFAMHRADVPKRVEQRISAVVSAAAQVSEAFVVGDEQMGVEVTAADVQSTSLALTPLGIERTP